MLVDPKTTLVQALCASFDIPASLVRLTYQGKELNQPHMTLEQYGITNNDTTIFAALRARPRATVTPDPQPAIPKPDIINLTSKLTGAQTNTIKIFLVHPTTGETHTAIVDPTTTVLRVLKSFDGIPASRMRLTYKGQSLTNLTKTLTAYGISAPNETLVASMRTLADYTG